MPLSRRSFLAGALAVPALAAVSACAGTVVQPGDLSRLRLMAPASTGGGWDTTARTLQSVIQRTGIARNVQVFNVEGAGGTIGLGQLAREDDDALLMMMGLVMVGAIDTNDSSTRLTDVTPIARLIGEAEVIVVPEDSPYDDLAAFVDAWRADPRGTPIAGGSAGGTDQVLAGLLALEADVDAAQINYIAYSGGGESLSALLGSQVAAGIGGTADYAEQVRAGRLKALAVSTAERTDQVDDVPTIIEAGFDVEVTNWRGLMARPGMSDQAREDLIQLVVDAHATDEWQQEIETRGWIDQFTTGEEYGAFLAEEETRVREVLTQIGLIS
ncbi:tripartite tricarboxylate transporter substrate binding protein [Modestobacter sp. I12A-02628]|uniref:Tripartite tricarboxylate transporter substrate binding protein n=1 Tax=Goekera deserti TaxID=2497753 RepID=A0A7K3WJN7_9ACTN|nr:tripartite tricarboxylate transporter substrate binding protein [Goekera deserti]MPR00418.1 tripartite tricarboxylate transporter substrate binding protein [Goekera deserti]NDI50378.1 tripartite tricarboxylate transporter substrate binding protein [Goekera deserti]NEL56677.1 tripartite tricarboxylate transporter substrate binding protein [Goekera deserti]